MNDSELIAVLQTMSDTARSGNNADWVPQPEVYDMIADMLGPTITDALVCAASCMYGGGSSNDGPSLTPSSSTKRNADDDLPPVKRPRRSSSSSTAGFHTGLPPPPPYRSSSSSSSSAAALTFHAGLPPPPYRPSTSSSSDAALVLPPPSTSQNPNTTVLHSSLSPPPPYCPTTVDLSDDDNDCQILWSSCTYPSPPSAEPLDLSVNYDSDTSTISIETVKNYLPNDFSGEGWSDWSVEDF